MRAMLFALMVLLAAPSGAWAQEEPFVYDPSKPWPADGPIKPPTRYVHDFKGDLGWKWAEPEHLFDACSALFREHGTGRGLSMIDRSATLDGCAVDGVKADGTRWCRIIYDGTDEAWVHELAHCNGWAAHHPMDAVIPTGTGR